MNRRDYEEMRRQRLIRYGRRANLRGDALEAAVAELLAELQRANQILAFTWHEHHSEDDEQGKDFTYTALSGKVVSFGVTTSLRSRARSRNLHPEYPQICFPIGTNKDTMRKKLLKLSEDQ